MKRKITIILSILFAAFLGFLCIPVPKFETSYSTVVTDENRNLLGARVAGDGQWRFPATNCYSDKYTRCVLEYEDKYFFLHPGFNPVSFIDAAIDNIKAGRVLRGGSTITMQVVRLSRNGQPRTIREKIIEVILAMRLELRYSKKEIFDLYAAHAPFGGNVVGIDAAAWRYFNTTPDRLTWSEAATLAVLPNSPSLVNPSKGRDELKKKRDLLLSNLCESKAYIPRKNKKSTFGKDEMELALMESIPPKPYDLPTLAYHYVCEIEKSHRGEYTVSSINYDIQKKVNEIAKKHHKVNTANGIENIGIYVIDFQEKEAVAYVGNHLGANDAAMVDMVRAQRSTGSILKPFLYAVCLDEGLLLPAMLLPDIPINLSGYTPQNYTGDFMGAVPADVALQKSLNTPFVQLLKQYSVPKFHNLLKGLGLSGIVFNPDHYGFSLILGGAESSLYDIVNAYGAMAAKLYDNESFDSINGKIRIPFSREAISLTFDAMRGLNRPDGQSGWRFFASSRKVAWKTGTSFGFKDAWAVGITGRYVIGVWCGNADGEGRPGLTGIGVAAPVLFDVVDILDNNLECGHDLDWMEVEVCAESGMPKSQYCTKTETVRMPKTEIMTGVCPYHKKVFLDKTHQYQVFAGCYDIDNENFEIYFSLPPVMEWFYRKKDPLYRSLPPVMPGCNAGKRESVMSFIYPEESANLIIPHDIKGERQSIIFEIAHRNPKKHIFWTLNDTFLGMTANEHQMPIDAKPGSYVLRCVDEDGNEISRKITIK